MSGLNLHWSPPGPVAAAFMGATARVQILNGPVGSGKTTGVMVKLIRLASQQQVSSRDFIQVNGQTLPVRKFKVCCVRDTYRQLWKTTLQSWFKRVPRDVGVFTGATDGPANHRVVFALADGTAVDFSMDFIAIGENAAEDVLRGYEPTCFYLNEADLLAKDVYIYARGRAGRYPDMAEGGPSWYGVLMDCNAPELTNWLFQDVFRNPPETIALFRQPSGLSPQAENLRNLPDGYYRDQIAENDDFYVKRMVENIAGLAPMSPEQFISADLVTAATSPHRQPMATLYDPLVMGVDVARFGRDVSIIRFRRGRDGRTIPPIKLPKIDTMSLAAKVADQAKARDVAAIFVDGGGVGGGVVDRLRQLGLQNVYDVQFGAASDRQDFEDGKARYANKRAEMWGNMRSWLTHGAIDDDPALIGDLTSPVFSMVQRDGYDAILLESKDSMRRRGLASPDNADALALTFAYPILPRRFRENSVAKMPEWDPFHGG